MKKKIYTNMTMMALVLMSILIFTSCDSDEWTAYDLDGDWYGQLQSTTYSERYGTSDTYYTQMSFTKQDKYGGYGVEYDYPVDNGYYYTSGAAKVSFQWYVKDGDIYIKYSDTQWKTFVIENPNIGYDRFTGNMYELDDNGNVNQDKEIFFDFTRDRTYQARSFRSNK